MANTLLIGQYVPHGVNEGNFFWLEASTPALAAADTLQVQIPDHLDKNALPVSVLSYGAPSGTVYTLDGDLALTSHDSASGVTTLTAGGGGLVAGSRVLIGYLGALNAL